MDNKLTLPEISPEFKPNYSFVETREITITDWFKTFFVTFALYRARQRIPKIDGFAETQRKIVWNALVNNYINKEKSEDILSDVNKSSQYHHGIASKENVYNNLVAPYKNNLRLFKADGNFGFRYIQEAAAIRYTYSRNQKILKKIFHDEDIIATHSYRTTEGKPCEPETLYPILPIGVINGQNQIGVGFASTLLPRKVETILDLFIGILSGTVTNLPAYLPPEYPYYNGKVDLLDVNKWSLKGKVQVEVAKRGKKIIRITEVPPNWDKYILIKKLEDFKDSGLIENYQNNSVKNTFNIEISSTKLENLPEDKILEKLELETSVTESFVYYTSDDKFQLECKNIAEYINYFITERIKVYEARKKYLSEKAYFEMQKIIAIINYITEINEGRIEIKKKSEEELIAILKTYPENYLFVPLPEKFNYIPDFARSIVQQSGNYDYLFNIPIKSLTPKRIEDLTKRYQALYSEYQNLLNTTTVKMWLDDLLDFKQEYEKELKREKSKGLS